MLSIKVKKTGKAPENTEEESSMPLPPLFRNEDAVALKGHVLLKTPSQAVRLCTSSFSAPAAVFSHWSAMLLPVSGIPS